MKQKKIIEWLPLIEDSEIRTKAIENCKNGHLVAGDIKSALSRAFLWRSTPQGERYWMDIYKSDIKLIKDTI